jgi:molybdopterin molybdotransferase
MGNRDAVRETVTVDEARRRILTACPVRAPRAHLLADARGLVLAEQIVAGGDSPRFNAAAMDGFAVRAADLRLATSGLPVRLAVAGEVAAGDSTHLSLGAGAAIRIMTGAEIPPGADAVVPFELAREHAEFVEFPQPVPEGANLRRAGEDVRAGDVLLEPGTRLLPGHLGLLAADGRAEVMAHPRPRVAVIATGDELVEPGKALEPGQIWDSNSVMLIALVEQFGGTVVSRARVPDEVDALHSALHRAAVQSDLIVTVGSASRGDRDIYAALSGLEVEISLWDVRLKPGRPLVFGSVRGVPLIGLPGNPVAAFISAALFVRPAIVTMLGRLDIDPPAVPARVAEAISNPGGKRTIARMVLEQDDRGFVARLAGPQNVANLRTLGHSDGLLVVPESLDRVESGSVLDVILVDAL